MKKLHRDYWHIPLVNLLLRLDTNQNGLTEDEAQIRLSKFGYNDISPPKKSMVIFQFLERFKNPLVILLLFTCVVAFVLKERSDFFIIMIIVLLSVTLDFFQEYSANNAAEKLRQSIALKVRVLRDGILTSLSSKELVPGDIVYLKAGDMVPADGRLVRGNHLFINQSILTGESFPVEKSTANIELSDEHQMDIESATNSVFMGTSVVSGEAHMVVCVTGNKAYLGHIAASLKKETPPSHFELETRKFGFFLMKITIFLVLFVLMVNIFLARPWLETFLFALALAIGMSPEFLPMIMSVSLSQGAKKMAKKHVIVKRLSAIHDLGAMNILCTDKTGTLTKAKIEMIGHIDSEAQESDHVLELAYLNSTFETGLSNPMDTAILNHSKLDTSAWEKLDEIPFDFERRRVSVLIEKDKQKLMITKGAPEDVLSICTHYEQDGKIEKLTTRIHKSLKQIYQTESKKGFRILGVAYQDRSHHNDSLLISHEKELIFAGFALFYDAPKREAARTLSKLRSQQVEVYILTGDSEDVTQHLCHELKIPVKGVLTGSEITALGDQALSNRIQHTNLYCRMNPNQKRRIILLLKSMGFVVGYMGDGINDAPSLHSANIGISVDTGADVAKEASDIILLKDNLEVIHDAVDEGRKIYSNIIKYLMMMTSSNFGNMFSMAGASLILPFLPMLPIQILLNNLMYDVSQTTIPYDNVDKESTLSPKQWDLKLILKFMLIMGPLSSLFDFFIFYIMLKIMKAPAALFQTGWFMESLATQILIIFVIRTRKSIFVSKPHPYLIISAIILVGLGILIPYTSLASHLGFVPPPLYFLMIIVGIAIIYLIVAEKLKQWVYAKIA